jgi:hypothetical protein
VGEVMLNLQLLALFLLFNPPRHIPVEFPALQTKGDAELLKCYAWAAQISSGTKTIVGSENIRPLGIGCIGQGTSDNLFHHYYLQARTTISQRHQSIVPELVEFIDQEYSLPEARKKNLLPDLLCLLRDTKDVRAVPLLLKILEQPSRVPDGSDHLLCKRQLAALTCLSFSRDQNPQHYATQLSDYSCVPHPKLQSNNPATIASYYRDWLRTEGKDSSQWLNVARKNARLCLQGDESRQYQAALFLSYAENDDRPAETLQWLAATADAYRMRPTPQMSHLPWLVLMTRYGTLAQGYTDRFIKEFHMTEGKSGALGFMQIGGDAVMRFAIMEMATPTFTDRAVNEVRYINNMNTLERVFDRWAGIPFDSVQQRIDWWNKNKIMDVETRLRHHLPALAEMADQPNNFYAISYMHIIVPETLAVRQEAPFKYSWWVTENQKKLRYQPRYGTFRLVP